MQRGRQSDLYSIERLTRVSRPSQPALGQLVHPTRHKHRRPSGAVKLVGNDELVEPGRQGMTSSNSKGARMESLIGRTLGHYRIAPFLGEGGVGARVRGASRT